MSKQHNYTLTLKWTGNKGAGTSNYKEYERSHSILINNKPEILGSSDTAFRGDKTKHNPEDFLLASVSSCHMLWYLHLCADAGIVVTNYIDNPTGILVEPVNAPGHFSQITLNPVVTITNPALQDKAKQLHAKAHQMCFIANSVNFPVNHNPTIIAVQ
jgi:organic hydroperoxide reductase OsmC/OhrA